MVLATILSPKLFVMIVAKQPVSGVDYVDCVA